MAATPYRRRLEQSRILVVPVVERESAAATSAVADVGPGRWELLKDVVKAFPGAGAGRWLAWPTRNDDWSGYFRRLMGDAAASGGYLTISTSGMIRGSGVGAPGDILGPEGFLRMQVCQIFQDRQRFPDLHPVIVQHRNLAGR